MPANARNTALEVPTYLPDEVNLHSVSFDGKLDSGELLTGVPTVVEQVTSDLTISNIIVNTAELRISNQIVAIGRAVQFKAIGQLVANSPYTLLVTAGTDSSPAQTKQGYVTFRVAER